MVAISQTRRISNWRPRGKRARPACGRETWSTTPAASKQNDPGTLAQTKNAWISHEDKGRGKDKFEGIGKKGK